VNLYLWSGCKQGLDSVGCGNMTKVEVVAAATAPGAGESLMIGAVQLLVLLALLAIVIGVPFIAFRVWRNGRG
jgi:hypothetical protein